MVTVQSITLTLLTLTVCLNTFVRTQCNIPPEFIYPSDYGPNLRNGHIFDFIVVGAGSAGSIVASRLAENPFWTILLLEAGVYPSAESEIPLVHFSLARTPEDWDYDIEPSTTACLGLKNQTCKCIRGKALGGSSTINGMIYLRGNRRDFDTWAEDGNIDWNYDEVLKYYKRIEDLTGVEDDRFGTGGDLKLSQYSTQEPVREIFIDAYEEMGYSNYQETKPIGFLDSYMTIWKGSRYSAAKAFLAKTKHWRNLYVALNAQVSKVLVDRNLAVFGVEVRINGKMLRLFSRKEVILSAGTVNSPQILMNSGIGPKSHLESVGIPVIKNLNVGQNLQDHLLFPGLLYNLPDSGVLPKTCCSVKNDWYLYFMYKTGPATQSGSENFLFLFNTKNNSEYPNLEVYYALIHKDDPYDALKTIQIAFNLPDEVIQVQYENNKKAHSLYIAPVLAHPKSKGQILLRSADPFDTPRILTNYLSDDDNEDLNVLYEGIRFYQNLTKTQSFSLYSPELVHIDIANCRGFQPDSEEYWKCSIRNLANTDYHLVGTCKMGPGSDPDAVVNSRLRIHGMKNIRVIDGSVMPKIVSCNTNAPIIMIGEKGACMIKEDWHYHQRC